MFSKTYYQDKQIKLQKKLAKIKDQHIADYLNMAQRLADEIKEIQTEHNEIENIIRDSETKEEPIKPNKKGK